MDDGGEKVGSIQRNYKNPIQKVSDFIFNNSFIINVTGFNKFQECVCEINEVINSKTLIKSQWTGKSTVLGAFRLFDRTKIATSPRFEVQTEKCLFHIKKNFGDRKVYIHNENGHSVGIISYDRPIPPQSISIKLYSDEMDYLEAAAFYLLVTLKY